MVLRENPATSKPPPYPQMPLDATTNPFQSGTSGTAGATAHDVENDFVNLSLNANHELDESSDWDASDREDNDTSKIVDDQPQSSHVAPEPNRQQPRLTEEQIPDVLRLKKPSTANLGEAAAQDPQPISNLDAPSNAGLGQSAATAAPARSATNPFRRPSDYKLPEPTPDTKNISFPEPTQAEALPATTTYQPAQMSNPWQEDSSPPFLASEAVPTHATHAIPNPWAAEQVATVEQQITIQQQGPAEEDLSHMAPLIDIGSEEQPHATGGTTQYPENPQMQANPSIEPQESNQAPVTPQIKSNGQRNEHYQIKHIRWYDPRSKQNPRQSPVLTQNANGPCPLLALVNALSLSTPPGLQTALIDTLRTREQVSLGLLLDAVFDELMSGRRGATAQELPDVGELYTFLVTLHTGMNVNPRFTPDETGNNFEQTKEMLLYSTFAVPLVHGWIPDPTSAACTAFRASAPSYEDAQNIQFRQEDLEARLGTSTFSSEEEALLRDLPEIKQFLNTWPTQLTTFGLQSLKRDLPPGEIAILFRNDHFSTLYKEPKRNQLMTLVTDAGYSNHDEIVWESLVDVNGADSELYSGDFRSVSHASQAQAGGDWETVQGRKGRKYNAPPGPPPQQTPAARPTDGSTSTVHRTHTEQEDADLAYALQLQEEEEQRQQAEQAARRREERLSETYLDNESARRGPQIPNRRGRRPQSEQQSQQQPPQTNADGDVLPSYAEAQAATRPTAAQVHSHGHSYAQPNQPQRTGMGRIPGAVPLTGRRGRRQNATPFDGGTGMQSDEAVANRREGCSLM